MNEFDGVAEPEIVILLIIILYYKFNANCIKSMIMCTF